MNLRIISIGTLPSHPLWGERGQVRTGHATTSLIVAGDKKILVDPGLPEQMLVARLDAAERAALRRTPTDLQALEAALARMDEAVARGADGVRADDDFHCAIAVAGGNPLIGRFVAFVSHEFSASRAPTWSRGAMARHRTAAVGAEITGSALRRFQRPTPSGPAACMVHAFDSVFPCWCESAGRGLESPVQRSRR